MQKSKKEKNPIVEIIKFLAACEIVSFHVGAPWSSYIHVLPVFMIFTFSMLVNSHATISLQVKKSFKRIVVPWIFWSGIFAFLKIIQALKDGHPIKDEFNWLMLITGTSVPLWYLPFLFIMIIIVFSIIKHFRFQLNYINGYLLALFSSVILLVSAFLFPKVEEYYPFGEWLYVFPAIPIGLLFSSHYYKFRTLLFSYGVWIIIVISGFTIFLNWKIGTAHLFATCLSAIVFSYSPPKSNKLANYLGEISYGLYLIHGLGIAFWLYLGIKPGSCQMVLLTIILSIIVTSIIRKTKFKKFI